MKWMIEDMAAGTIEMIEAVNVLEAYEIALGDRKITVITAEDYEKNQPDMFAEYMKAAA